MSSLAGTVLGVRAVARVTGAGAFTRQRGFSAIVHNGAGDITLTLKEAIDFAGGSGYAIATLDGNALAGAITVKYLTATTIQVFCANAAGMAADGNFSIEVKEIGPN